MKITKTQLKRIIKEELEQVVSDQGVNEIFGFGKKKSPAAQSLLSFMTKLQYFATPGPGLDGDAFKYGVKQGMQITVDGTKRNIADPHSPGDIDKRVYRDVMGDVEKPKDWLEDRVDDLEEALSDTEDEIDMGRDVSESVMQTFEKIKAMYGNLNKSSDLRGMLMRLAHPTKFSRDFQSSKESRMFDGSKVLEFSAVMAITDAADEIYGLFKQVKKLK
jgi:hypothetical protein